MMSHDDIAALILLVIVALAYVILRGYNDD